MNKRKPAKSKKSSEVGLSSDDARVLVAGVKEQISQLMRAVGACEERLDADLSEFGAISEDRRDLHKRISNLEALMIGMALTEKAQAALVARVEWYHQRLVQYAPQLAEHLNERPSNDV